MASTTAPAPPGSWQRDEHDLSLARLHLLRATFLLLAAAGLFIQPPALVNAGPTARGMTEGILAGLWAMSFLGLRYPLQMLPILLFEFVWRMIWLIAFGLPQWMSGVGSPRLGEDLILTGLGPILFGLVIPWGYVWRHYVKAPAERWVVSGAPSIWTRGEHDVSLVRLYTLRAIYLFFAVDGFLVTLPLLIDHDPVNRGIILGFKGGLWITAIIGIRYPLQMLPVLIFEILWKFIWLFAFGLPQTISGVGSPRLAEDMILIGMIPIVLGPILMPWGHIWCRYVKQPAEHWR